MRHLSSRLQLEVFFLAFFTCIAISWFTLVVKKDFVVFTDPETVPASVDFFATLLGIPEETEEE